MKLTSNQFSILLAIYRGTIREVQHYGTYSKDVQHLIANKLVVDDSSEGLEVTTAGYDRVQRALLDEQRAPTNWKIPADFRCELKELYRKIRQGRKNGTPGEIAKVITEALDGPRGEWLKRYTLESSLYDEDFTALRAEVDEELRQQEAKP